MVTVTENAGYIDVKDMRGDAFEPVVVLSGYHYKDGLGYYQSRRNVAKNFFFSHINSGT